MKTRSLSLVIALALAACGPAADKAAAPTSASDQPAEVVAPAPADAAPADSLGDGLAGDWRSEKNKARDAYRHPRETLEFFGVKPGQTLIEITPGGGWYAEVLAPLMKGNGTYIAAFPVDSTSDYAKRSNDNFRAMLVSDPARLGEAKTVEYDVSAPNLGPDGSADVVLTFRNVHNWGDNAPAMFKAFYAVLKPGGTLGVVDHRAADGASAESLKGSGYITTASVKRLASDAGFELAAESEINANPKDTKDYEKGVWTLPPSLALGDTDRDKYLAIGESDRMTLKFQKPAGDRIFEQGTDAGAATPAQD